MTRLDSFHITTDLQNLPSGKCLINTVNAWSFVVAQRDESFARALRGSGALIPDGMSIVWALRFLGYVDHGVKRIAGWDLFVHEMTRLDSAGGKCFFLGSSERVLSAIRKRAASDYPNVTVETFSPPYRDSFSQEENAAIIDTVNSAAPDLLWIGMTAPKQEKWAFEHWDELNINCHCGTVGAVFDFYAGTARRAPLWMQHSGLEWLYRLAENPRRLCRRYLYGNFKFIFLIFKEKFSNKKTQQ